MRYYLVAVVLCLHAVTVLTLSSNTCSRGCSCIEEDDGSADHVTSLEGLASAVGAMAPLVVGGSGLALYKVLKSLGSAVSEVAEGSSDLPPSPSLANKRGSWEPSYKDSPSPYHGRRRGSTPLSLLGEDDISFDDSMRSPPGRDLASRWM